MTHYQKLATMIFRIVGILAMAAGIIFWIPAAIMTFFLPQQITDSFQQQPIFLLGFVPNLIYLIVGMLFFTLSRFLAKWICLDFNRFND